ncbi:MAG: tRNA (cytidine(34)-2'-O)-methyltransferase [Phycisphaerales bacterium]
MSRSAPAGGLAAPVFQVVLHEPEIPNNTGNIGRTCIATGCGLHLIRPLGFDTGEKACRRAGLDYWPRLGVREHDSWGSLLGTGVDPARVWCFSTRRGRPVFDAGFQRGDWLVFGKETGGLPGEILDAAGDRSLLLPMVAGERSLNLATAVCAAVYEGIRQLVARGALAIDGSGRIVEPAARYTGPAEP